jgi:competence ComEA-like helix-hairpin-helix protein
MPPKPLLALLALAVLGHGVRLALIQPGEASGSVEIMGSRSGVERSAASHRDSIAALSRPLADGERINLDVATVPEIARLPRVGVALGKRIAADRAARGPFGSLAGLDRVAGIGPGLLRAVEPHVEFSAGRKSGGAEEQKSSVDLTRHHVAVQAFKPSALPLFGSSDLHWLNAATAAQLDSLPGIGPARAAAVVRYREMHGPFAAVADLALVPGINPALLQRLYDRLQVP